MNRKEFLKKTLTVGVCPAVAIALTDSVASASEVAETSIDVEQLQKEKAFVSNWLSDLFDGMDEHLDDETRAKIMSSCGKGCYHRHSFKSDISKQANGNLDDLIEAYGKNYEVWKADGELHIRYGETSANCYCPAAKYHPAKPNDAHCECTRSTHQAIIENALNRSVDVRIVESLRRGGKTCHFIAQV